jgi:hypothetical protein
MYTHPHIDQRILNVRMSEEDGWDLLDDVFSDVRYGQVRCSIENAEIDDHLGFGCIHYFTSECGCYLLLKKLLHFDASEHFDSFAWLVVFRVT